MYFRYGLSMLTAEGSLLDEMDGISRNHEVEEHIYPSKYESRESIVHTICTALATVSICSICGNGATSLAKKLTEFARQQRSFRRVAMLTVPQNPILEIIRKDIQQKIRQGQTGTFLLILDGFWWELNNRDFIAIGIPSPTRSFKIVLTSRTEDMCAKIGRHQIYHVNFLEDEEAWDLFKEQTRMSFVDSILHEMARKIVDECDGVLIATLTIASTLRDKTPNVWEVALRKLQFSYEERFSDKAKVFSRTRVSYDLLNDKEAQLFFCFCCLFPEDYNIPVVGLVLHAKGLQLFENVNSVYQATDRVERTIHQLKNTFFLLDGDEDDCVKVHGILHDFGVSVSSEMEYPYVVRCENAMKLWPLETIENQKCRAISLMCQKMENHPVNLKCPELHLLLLSFGSDSAQLPTGLFEGLQNLKVLSLNIPSLSQSLVEPKGLRALFVTESMSNNSKIKPRPRVGDLLGDEMKDLEVFSFSTARPYDDFPREIGLWHNLRYLRFNPERLKYIPPGVFSKLAKLEELYLPQDFIGWGCKEEGGDRMNASLSELESLQLTAIGVSAPKGSILAQEFVVNLTRFRVFIGGHVSPDYEFGSNGYSNKLLEVFDADADDFTVSWVSALVWRSESLRLKQVRNLKNVITWQGKQIKDPYIEFPQWKKICVSDCKELEYIAEGQIPWTSFSQLESLKLFGLCIIKELWPGLYTSKIKESCFGNLGEIQIMFCRKLQYIFLVSVAAEMRQLQSLQICFCDEMETIFCREQMNHGGIQVETSSKEGKNASKGKTQLRDPTVVNARIHHKSKLISLTSNPITKRLFGRGKQPKFVSIQQQMEDEKDVAKDAIIFPRLKTMEFSYMGKFQVFYDGNHSIVMPSLQSVSIFQCNHLEAFSYGSFKTPLLKQILINRNRYSVTKDLNAIVKNLNCF